VTPGIPRRAIPVISQERSTPNPPLTTPDGEETILEVALEFLSFQKDALNEKHPDLDLKNQGHFERWIRRESEDLWLCYLIAQGSKHRKLRANVDPHDFEAVMSVTGAMSPRTPPAGVEPEYILIERPKIKIRDKTYDAMEAFLDAHKFWWRFFNIWKIRVDD
jgi:hypothetical protein